MRPIQLVLVAALGALVVIYFRRLRSTVRDRLVLLALAALGTTLALVPELSTGLAHYVGVGRGVDLFIYLSFVGVLFLLLVVQAEIRQLQEKLTEVVRAVAILTARPSQHEPRTADTEEHEAGDRGGEVVR